MDLAMTREKALGSFSFDVAKRMLDVLREHGTAMKKTTLASRAGLNYNVCLRYIRMLNSLGWIEVNPEVSITEAGKVAFAKFLDESRASDIGVHYVLSSNTKDKRVEHPSSYDILSSTTTIAHRMSQSSSILNVIQQPLLGSKKKTYSRNNN